MSLGSRINEIRKARGLSIDDLCQLSGIPKGTLSKITAGITTSPTLDTVRAIANALDCRLDDFDDIPKKGDAINQKEQKMVKKYRCLDDYGKEAVDDVLDVEYRRVIEDREKEAAAARWRSGKQKQLMRFLRQKRRETEAADEPANVQRFPVPYYLQASSAGYGEWAESGYAEEIDLVKRPPFGTSFIVPVNGDSMEPTYPDGCKVFVRRQTEIRVGEVGIFFMDGKQWIKELGEGELISHNPAYPTRPMTDDICCQGLVLGICDDSYFAKAY